MIRPFQNYSSVQIAPTRPHSRQGLIHTEESADWNELPSSDKDRRMPKRFTLAMTATWNSLHEGKQSRTEWRHMEFPKLLLEQINSIDRQLYPVWNKVNSHWELWRHCDWTRIGLPHDPTKAHLAFACCRPSGTFQQPDQRLIKTILNADLWKKHGRTRAGRDAAWSELMEKEAAAEKARRAKTDEKFDAARKKLEWAADVDLNHKPIRNRKDPFGKLKYG